ncbi:MAG: histidine--tRNA ligase [Chlamydiales bacterium]|nr:histidine--tRNA ligase [Chlamydiales bacterium]
MSIAIPKGTYDILPVEPDVNFSWRQSRFWNYLETTICTLAKSYGFQEVRTPLFERTELFQRGVGDSSDIVSKEMYTFEDKAGRSMSLRPEMTASVMRAFIEKQLHLQSPLHKLFYIGPMFRYDRPQAGRYRQFHQFGAEAIGNGSEEQDVEIIDLLYSLYESLGLKNLTLHINSVGDSNCRGAFRQALQDFLTPVAAKLSPDSQIRLKTNPLRILDSKDPADHALLEEAPSLKNYLNDECKSNLEKICNLLTQLNIPFNVNAKLVRGLDYYNKTVFEITSGELGAQNTIGAGGRYDGLIKTLGGPNLPAVGFATGIERILQTLIAQNAYLPVRQGPTLFIIALGASANTYCFTLLKQLRQNGIFAEMDFSDKKLKDKLRYADSLKAKYSLVIGENELLCDKAELKEMQTHTTETVTLSCLIQKLKSLP